MHDTETQICNRVDVLWNQRRSPPWWLIGSLLFRLSAWAPSAGSELAHVSMQNVKMAFVLLAALLL